VTTDSPKASGRRNHIVYILGAGFSAPAKIPVIADFLNEVRRNFEDPAAPPMGSTLEGHHKAVLEFRHKIGRARDSVTLALDDIEVLFSLLEMEVMVTSSDSALAASMRHVICHTVTKDIQAIDKPRVRIKLRPEFRDALLADPALKKFALEGDGPDPFHLELNYYTYALALMLGYFRSKGLSRSEPLSP
jgi:hypothetical protein